MSNTTKSCRWVLIPYSKGINALYCDKKVGYINEKQPDGSIIRRYKSFCDKHQRLADIFDDIDNMDL